MLAGIFDPRPGSDPERLRDRVERAFRADPAARTVTAGRLVVVSNRAPDVGPAPESGCILEGTILNRGELAEELGLPPTSSPEQVVSAGYERLGEGILDRLRGGFDIVVWSDGGERVLLAQDQVGLRTLFLHRAGEEIAFGDEIHHVLALLPRRPGPDAVQASRFLMLDWNERRATAYEGVRRLGAGHRIAIERAHAEERRYWFPEYRPPAEQSALELAAELRATLLRAVEVRTRGVENVGIMLSGGFDSSAVAGALREVRGTDGPPIRGYSAVFPDDPKMDERAELDALREKLGVTSIRYQPLPGGALELCLLWVDEFQLPLSGPGYAVEHSLMRRAGADGIGVVLDGQGGDEIFGLPLYMLSDRVRQGRVLSAIELLRSHYPRMGQRAPWRFVAKMLAEYGITGALPQGVYRAARRFDRPQRHALDWLNETTARRYFESIDALAWANDSGKPRWWLQHANVLVHDREDAGLGDYARQRAALAGIEARPPLFDVEMIELALRIPPELGFDPFLDRPLARQAMAGLVPDIVRLSRRKSNLAPLHVASMTGPDLAATRRLLTADDAEIYAYARREAIERLLAAPPGPTDPARYDWINAVWTCTSMECWLKWQADPSFPDRFRAEANLSGMTFEDLSPR